MTSSIVDLLRQELKEQSLAAYIIASEDSHYSEYISDHDKRRAFISGFTGSAGTAVVTLNSAALWVDGRYWLQAQDQIDSSVWTLMRAGDTPAPPSIEDWLQKVCPTDSVVGIDPLRTSVDSFRVLVEKLKPAISCLPIDGNLVDKIWKNQPPLSSDPIVVHPFKYSGQHSKEKIRVVREELIASSCCALVVSQLDEICWLLNLRGSDITFNPVFISYCVVTLDEVRLFVNPSKLDDSVRSHLGDSVILQPYEELLEFLPSLDLDSQCKRVSIYPKTCNVAIHRAFVEGNVCEQLSPISLLKACKNQVELDGMRKCHVRDGVAKTIWLSWMKKNMKDVSECKYDEVDVADVLENERRKQPLFMDLSFTSISSTGSNGSIIHYSPQKGSCAVVDRNKLFLMDSGAQYRDGTTDVTRTFHLGTPSAKEIDCFTRVLRGHIGLAMAKFPENVPGEILDILARRHLWEVGLEYNHGTGHGVGSYLNVHEGPMRIGPLREGRVPAKLVGLKPGMVVSNEPGFYEEGEFGVRVESLVIIRRVVNSKYNFGNLKFLEFETITLVPIQLKLIDKSQLSPQEIDWINRYHQKCLSELGPSILEVDEEAHQFLVESCKPL
uniref:Creatinase/aminopeptidase n=2 Tax=Hirondellea gigas TaxID=1518452 RepID=A0A6A7G5Z7_9CRUS